MTKPPIISARGLQKSYKTGEVEVHALRGVDLDVDAGEFVAIVVPSGSGKSTLFHILGGLTPPTSGVVTLAGTELGSISEAGRTASRSAQFLKIGQIPEKWRTSPRRNDAGSFQPNL